MAGFGEAALWGGTGRLEPRAGAEAGAAALSEDMSAAALMGTRESGAGVGFGGRDEEDGPRARGGRLVLWCGGVLIQSGSGLMEAETEAYDGVGAGSR